MVDKNILVENIKRWVNNDNELKQLQKRVKELRADRKKLSEIILNTMKTHSIDCFDIKDGQLLKQTKRTKQPINKKTLENLLSEYFKNDLDVNTGEVCEFIMENREIKVKEELRKK